LPILFLSCKKLPVETGVMTLAVLAEAASVRHSLRVGDGTLISRGVIWDSYLNLSFGTL
jgi:hypothetical protein